MKVTFNISFVLCVGTIATPLVKASLNGFGLTLSAAKKRFIQHQDVFDFAAQQSHRGLKSTTATALLQKRSAPQNRAAKNQKAVEVDVRQQRRSLQTDVGTEIDATSLVVCEVFLEALLGPNSGCTCTDDGEISMECNEFIYSNCLICDTLQGEDACLFFDVEAVLAASPGTDSNVDCLTYESGPFADNTICGIENLADNTCTFTIEETDCTSCTVVACDGETTFDIDCSNIIAGETWNLCTDDIPETSPFIAVGTNDRFEDLNCGDGGVDPNSLGLALCQTFLDQQFGVDSGCICEFDGQDFIPSCVCVFKACETLQGEEACLLVDEEAALVASPGVDSITDCLTYESGPFADNTICLIEDFSDSSCAITIDGMECNSCDVVNCSDTDGIGVLVESYDLDCSNIIAGETWSLCSDDIPDTSPFIAVGNNLLFSDVSCIDGSASDGSSSADSSNPGGGESGTSAPSPSSPGDGSIGGRDSGGGGDTSGSVAASSHVLSLVGIIIVTCFW